MKYVFLILAMVLPAMAGREFVSGSSQHAVCSISPISPPFTLHAWFKASRNDQFSCIIGLGTSTNTSELGLVFINGADTDDMYGLVAQTSAGASTSTKLPRFATNTWSSVSGVFASSTSRTLYTNGISAATSSVSHVIDGLDVVQIGGRLSGTWGGYMSGGISEGAVWDVALTASEILSLSQGAAPFMIRPASLVFYAPLTGRETSTEWNLFGAAVSLTNSPAAGTDHPRIYRP